MSSIETSGESPDKRGKLKPRAVRTTAKTKMAEVSGIVTVGPETAARLTKVLGREVQVGEQFDLGIVAYHHQNPLKRWWINLTRVRRKPDHFS